MTHSYGLHIVKVERNFRVPANGDDATLADNNLLEMAPVFEFDGNDLVARSGLSFAFECSDSFRGNLNEALHLNLRAGFLLADYSGGTSGRAEGKRLLQKFEKMKAGMEAK